MEGSVKSEPKCTEATHQGSVASLTCAKIRAQPVGQFQLPVQVCNLSFNHFPPLAPATAICPYCEHLCTGAMEFDIL